MSNTSIEVLRKASHQQLLPLIEYLDRPWGTGVKLECAFLDAQDDLTKIPDFIDHRVRLAGGHTLGNWFRGADVLEGPPYREVVADVCKAQKVKVDDNDDAATMEFKLISVLFERRWAKMTEAQRAEFIKAFKVQTGFDGALAAGMSFAALAAVLGPALLAVATTDFALALGAAGAAAALGEVAAGSLFGPIGVLMGALLVANRAMGPNLSATVPCVLHIASLRLQEKMDDTLGEAL